MQVEVVICKDGEGYNTTILPCGKKAILKIPDGAPRCDSLASAREVIREFYKMMEALGRYEDA